MENVKGARLCDVLFKLPRELRMMIYEFTIPTSQLIDPITNRFGGFDSTLNADKDDVNSLLHVDDYAADPMIHEGHDIDEVHLRPKNVFTLTQVCKALREDTLALAYGSNVFVLPGAGTRDSWTRQMTIAWMHSLPLAALQVLVIDLDGEVTRNLEPHQTSLHYRCRAYVQINFRTAETKALTSPPPCELGNCPCDPRDWTVEIEKRREVWEVIHGEEAYRDWKVTKQSAVELLDHYWSWL